MGKRMLSMLLVLAMLVSVLPTGAAAENVQPQVENSVTMEGTNSFGNLLANTMNESPEAQTEGEDNRVCDLVIEGSTATVEYTTTKNAKVVVAVYTEDGTKMLGSGTILVPTCWMPRPTIPSPRCSGLSCTPRRCRISRIPRWRTMTRRRC